MHYLTLGLADHLFAIRMLLFIHLRHVYCINPIEDAVKYEGEPHMRKYLLPVICGILVFGAMSNLRPERSFPLARADQSDG